MAMTPVPSGALMMLPVSSYTISLRGLGGDGGISVSSLKVIYADGTAAQSLNPFCAIRTTSALGKGKLPASTAKGIPASARRSAQRMWIMPRSLRWV